MDPMNMPFMQAATCTAAPELSCLGEHSQIKFCNFVAIKNLLFLDIWVDPWP